MFTVKKGLGFQIFVTQNLFLESVKKTEYNYEQNNIMSRLYYKPCKGVKSSGSSIYLLSNYHCLINAIAVMSFKTLGFNSILLKLLIFSKG
jgi:hypothetical protein